MKQAVYLFQPLTDGSAWQQALHRLGTEANRISDPEEILSLCHRGKAGILFADRKLLENALTTLGANLASWTQKGGAIVVTGAPAATPFPFPTEELGERRDPLIINDLLLRYLPDYSRRLPRIDTRLPGLFSIGKSTQLCEILSIGTGGAFIKTGIPLPETGTPVRITIALIGMCKEVELEATIVRHVTPNEYNNYQQGFGVCYVEAAPSSLTDLGAYMKNIVCADEAPLSFSPAFRPPRQKENETAADTASVVGTISRREKNLARIR